MYCTYILRSKSEKTKTYIGFTTNLTQRLKDHNRGQSKYTSKHLPWKIIYAGFFLNQEKATNFEKYLKTSSGKAFANKRLI